MGTIRKEVKRAYEHLMKGWNIEAELKAEIVKIKNLGFEVVEVAATPMVYDLLKEAYCAKHNIPVEEAENIEIKKYDGYNLRVLHAEYFNGSSMSGFGLPFRVQMKLPEELLEDSFYGTIEQKGEFETLKAHDAPTAIKHIAESDEQTKAIGE